MEEVNGVKPDHEALGTSQAEDRVSGLLGSFSVLLNPCFLISNELIIMFTA